MRKLTLNDDDDSFVTERMVDRDVGNKVVIIHFNYSSKFIFI